MNRRASTLDPGEPSLRDLLNDPVLEAILRRDRISRDDLLAEICAARVRLGLATSPCSR
ncbi:MAG: hypothetical protein JNK67_11260 [Alphaproteobacteria bacterium]|nr:hypothetical protein [Alphaproteobacteria bacterium]